ncbi:anaphase-promoting complex subunit 1 [Copidosoma floridanum]|uniref:anaphase-promoting complex subunit 1 n=1 Tax=Copidosoma floridanum TaxID=29053 RepID=UPI000C6FC8EF|nr:anaphase-promoting complex subunit 1 [Copidosoma floridanum]
MTTKPSMVRTDFGLARRLLIIRVCRHLRTRVGPTNSVVTYGSHVAIHMALGFLFIGGGSYTLSNKPSSVAALIISLFPKYPTHSNDNRYHLQALRHFYVLAVDPRLLLPKDIDSKKFCYAKMRITFQSSSEQEGQRVSMKAPDLLPQLNRLSKIELADDRYWKIILEKDRHFQQLENILNNNCVLHVKQRAGCLSHLEDPHGVRSILARTLTTEDIIVWSASLKQIISFTSNKTILNFIHRFLEKSTLLKDVTCDDYCTNKTHCDKNLLCFVLPQVFSYKKEDTYHQIHEVQLDISVSENNYLQTLIRITYECVIRDKVNLLPLWVNFTKSIFTIIKNVEIHFIWQIKFLYSLGLTKDYCKGLQKVLSIENILANKQQISFIIDSWEHDLRSALCNFRSTGHQFEKIQCYKKFISYMFHYNVFDIKNFFHRYNKDNLTKNRSCLEAHGSSRIKKLFK